MKEKYPKEHSNFFSIQTITLALLEETNLQFIFKKKNVGFFPQLLKTGKCFN